MKEIEEKLFMNDSPVKEEWTIKDIGSADWALSRIKATEKNYQESINYLNGVIEKAEALKKEFEEKINSENSFLIEKLKEWTKEKIKDQKSKTIKLLNGSLSIRKTPAKVDIISESMAFDFCEDKNLEVKLSITIEMKQNKIPELLKIIAPFDSNESFKWRKDVIKKEITNFFKSKKVDDADFPGGHYSSGGESFNIK